MTVDWERTAGALAEALANYEAENERLNGQVRRILHENNVLRRKKCPQFRNRRELMKELERLNGYLRAIRDADSGMDALSLRAMAERGLYSESPSPHDVDAEVARLRGWLEFIDRRGRGTDNAAEWFFVKWTRDALSGKPAP